MKDEATESMYQEAKEKGLWFHCAYQDLWFSPDELKEKQEVDGEFRWGVENWKLRDPQEQIDYLKREIEKAERELERFKKRVEESRG